MTRLHASLFVASVPWLAEPCRGCGHPRGRHLYTEGFCVHAERQTVERPDGTTAETSGFRYCTCRGYRAELSDG